MKSGLIIAPRLDIHAFAVRHSAAEMGREILIVDSSEFTADFDLCALMSGSESAALLTFREGERLDLSSICGLWWRRPGTPKVSQPGNESLSVIRERESREALFGALESYIPRAFNNLGYSRNANRKIPQLARARAMGFRVPDTLVTNSAEAVKNFFERHSGNVVFKTFSGLDIGFYPTRPLTCGDLLELHTLQQCPCIFQERIPGQFDLRITIVADKLFCARIDYDSNHESIDTRVSSTGCQRYVLPSSLANSLLDLVHSYGLVYSAVDMRFTDEGEYVFFEINPEGQYLWTEIEAELPISRAIAEQILMDTPST